MVTAPRPECKAGLHVVAAHAASSFALGVSLQTGEGGFPVVTVGIPCPVGIIVFEVTNRGSIPHDFRVCTARNKPLADSCDAGTGTRMISPGQSKTLRIGILRRGTYEYLCTVSGHASAGMKGTLKVS